MKGLTHCSLKFAYVASKVKYFMSVPRCEWWEFHRLIRSSCLCQKKKKKPLCLGTELHSQTQITSVCGNNSRPVLSGGITDNIDPSMFGGEGGREGGREREGLVVLWPGTCERTNKNNFYANIRCSVKAYGRGPREILFTSIVYRWRAGSSGEVRQYCFAAEVMILIVSKSHADFSGVRSNQFINQGKYLERVTTRR